MNKMISLLFFLFLRFWVQKFPTWVHIWSVLVWQRHTAAGDACHPAHPLPLCFDSSEMPVKFECVFCIGYTTQVQIGFILQNIETIVYRGKSFSGVLLCTTKYNRKTIASEYIYRTPKQGLKDAMTIQRYLCKGVLLGFTSSTYRERSDSFGCK